MTKLALIWSGCVVFDVALLCAIIWVTIMCGPSIGIWFIVFGGLVLVIVPILIAHLIWWIPYMKDCEEQSKRVKIYYD